MNIVGRRKLWFTISLVMIIPGIISLALWGLKLGIDFRGGQEMELRGGQDQAKVRTIFVSSGADDVTVTTTGNGGLLIRYRSDEKDAKKSDEKIKQDLSKAGYVQVSFSSVGPSVSKDITRNALISIFLASLAILLYIAFAFRNAPPPVSPWSFGGSAIIAMLHDALLLIGLFSILGHFFGVQVDSLFVTAVLTVIGFSVHDTIVVFDRVRENLRRYNKPFDEVVNLSVNETLARSLNTSITVILTLTALLLFGGESIRLFVLALLVGIISGTFSSIFNASPMLVVWNNRKLKQKAKKEQAAKKK
jgi:preprotein translocase subunit SecF